MSLNKPKTLLRVVIEKVVPEIDGGRFPITRTPGELVIVSADIFSDGHDVIGASLMYREEGDAEWHEEPMALVNNDRWSAEFRVGAMGTCFYTMRAWVDHFKTWSRGLVKKGDAGQDLRLDLLTGAQFVETAATRANPEESKKLSEFGRRLRKIPEADTPGAVALAEDQDLLALMSTHRDRAVDTVYEKELVDTRGPRPCALQQLVRDVPAFLHHFGAAPRDSA